MTSTAAGVPRRIVSLCPSNAEIVLALGAADRLVGADRWSLRDPRLGLPPGIADVGADLRADIDRIVALEPDLVLASRSVPGMEANVEAFERLGLPHIVVPSGSWQDVRLAVAEVARALATDDAREAGERLLADMDRAWEAAGRRAREAREAWEAREAREAQAASAGQGRTHGSGTGEPAAAPPRSGVWEWWPKPCIVAGRLGWPQDMMRQLGMENAFGEWEVESGPVEAEEIARRAPDAVFASWCGTGERRMNVRDIVARPGWAGTPAVRGRRVFLLPENPFGRPGPGLARGITILASLLFGDREEAAATAAACASEAGLAPDALTWPA